MRLTGKSKPQGMIIPWETYSGQNLIKCLTLFLNNGEGVKNKMIKTRNSKPKIDLTGKTFTYLTPLYYIKGGKWHCKC